MYLENPLRVYAGCFTATTLIQAMTLQRAGVVSSQYFCQSSEYLSSVESTLFTQLAVEKGSGEDEQPLLVLQGSRMVAVTCAAG